MSKGGGGSPGGITHAYLYGPEISADDLPVLAFDAWSIPSGLVSGKYDVFVQFHDTVLPAYAHLVVNLGVDYLFTTEQTNALLRSKAGLLVATVDDTTSTVTCSIRPNDSEDDEHLVESTVVTTLWKGDWLDA